MSLITDQINQLRIYADLLKMRDKGDGQKGTPEAICANVMREAATTIEELSAKARAANMEQSDVYYNGGWTPVSERLPDVEYGFFFATVRHKDPKRKGTDVCIAEYNIQSGFNIWVSGSGWNVWDDEDGFGLYVTAWMPIKLPEPYKAD